MYEEQYQPSLSDCLESLMARVFAAGDYYCGWSAPGQAFDPGIELEELVGQCVEAGAPGFDGAAVEELLRTRKPVSVDQLRCLNMEDGTHSILDCQWVSASPDFGAVAPFSDEELAVAFPSPRPSTELVRSFSEDEILDVFEPFLERWHGRSFVSYDGGVPDRTWFIGFSGD